MDLYGLIHARYIISPRGLSMMREKYLLGTFGSCQRILCDRQLVLPIGLSEELSTSRVKVSRVILFIQTFDIMHDLTLYYSDLLPQMLGSLRAQTEAPGHRRSLLRPEFSKHPAEDLPRPVPQGRTPDLHADHLRIQNLRVEGECLPIQAR